MTATKVSGPLFDGTADDVMAAFATDVEETIAQQGVNDIRAELHSVLQHPTGRYERNIQTERQADDYVITDGGIVYGPWLEGVSSRNNRSRFKGYSTFRRITQRLDAKAADIAEAVLAKYLGRLS